MPYFPPPLKTAIDEVLYNALKNHEERIDLTQFRYHEDQVPNIHDFIKQYPEFDYGDGFSALYYTVNSMVTRVQITYPAHVGDYDRELADAVAKAIMTIRTRLPRNPSEAEIVATISDFIATTVAYTFESDGFTPDTSLSTTYHAMVQGRGVCDAYADAFTLLARRFGLEVITVSGVTQSPEGEGNHAWNMVKVDGQWYHVDTTWNDPAPDVPGQAHHTYLLLSDKAIRSPRGLSESTHLSWYARWLEFQGDEIPEAVSTTYDDAFWVYEKTPLTFVTRPFAEREQEHHSATIESKLSEARKTGTEVVVYQFALTSEEVRARWNQLYPGILLVVTTPMNSDIVYSVQLQDAYLADQENPFGKKWRPH